MRKGVKYGNCGIEQLWLTSRYLSTNKPTILNIYCGGGDDEDPRPDMQVDLEDLSDELKEQVLNIIRPKANFKSVSVSIDSHKIGETEGIVVCDKCNHAIDLGDHFCWHCGADLRNAEHT